MDPKRPDIKINDPVVPPAAFPAPGHRVQCRPPRAVTIGIGVEDRLHQPLQIHGHHRLRDPVSHSGDGRFILPSCNHVSGCFWIGAELCWSGPRPRSW